MSHWNYIRIRLLISPETLSISIRISIFKLFWGSLNNLRWKSRSSNV